MSENTDKPLTVEPGPVVLRNCWTCGWANGASCTLPWSDANYISVGDFVAEHCQAADGMPARDADNCPGWKPKPEQATPTRVVRSTEDAVHGFDVYQSKHTPDTTITVQRAEWDALLADFATMESRVGDLERRQRTDNARVAATMRRDKLRGTR